MVNILTIPIIRDIILPFLLVFVITFAILEKTKLLGDNKSQVNAITAFVLAGIVISFGNAVNIITQMTAFLAVSLFVLFVFMLIYSFAYGNKDGNPLSTGIKTFIGVLVFVAIVIAMLVFTGNWNSVYDFFTTSAVGANVLFVILIGAAVYWVLKGDSGSSSSGKSG
jgi:hypothetical protein